jgi:voltage-gated potassium channel
LTILRFYLIFITEEIEYLKEGIFIFFSRIKGFKVHRSIRFLQKQFVRRPLISVLSLFLIIYVGITILITVLEGLSFAEASVMLLPAFLGELGVLEVKCFLTKIGMLASLLVSLLFVAVVTAKITTVFVEFVARGGSIVKKVNFSKHIIICGWNFQGKRIVEKLQNADLKVKKNIVILANLDTRPVQDERVEFIKGDPTQDEDLLNAGVKKASSVIVLSDLRKEANEADAEALMIVLAVESLHREVHTSVQLLNSANRIHLERAHADEIICLDQLGGSLSVASSLNPGVSNIITELLTFNSGSEFYRYDRGFSDEIIGKEFSEVVSILAKRKIILLGVEIDDSPEIRKNLSMDVLHKVEDKNKLIVINPQSSYKIQQGDALFIIAESEPINL